MLVILSTRADGPGLLDAARALVRRRWPAGLAVFAIVLGMAAALVFLTSPIHRTEARLRLGEPPPMTGVSPTAGILGLWRLGGDPFSNDLELLRSRSLAEAVTADAALNTRLRAPRGWTRDSLVVRLEADRTTERARFRASWTADGRVSIRRAAPSDSAIGDVATGEPVTFGGVTAEFRPWRAGMPREIEIRTLPFAEAARLTRQQLGVERVRREANVVDLQFNHRDEGVSQSAVQAMVRHFVALRTEIQRRESRETVDSLRLVAERTAEELRAAESALESFQRETRLLSPDAQGEAFVERYAESVRRLTEARSELEAVRSLLRRAEAAPDPAQSWIDVIAHPRFLNNPTMSGLAGRLRELEARRQEIAQRRTEANIEHRLILEQIADVNRALRSLVRSHEVALAEQVGRLEADAAALDAVLAAVPADAIEVGRRERAVRLLSELLVVTEQRLRQEELREALTFANVQVIDPPALRDRPVWPRKKLGLAVGLLLASVSAVLGMAVVERADRTVRRAAEVEAAIGAPVLAAVIRSGNGRPAFASHEVWAVLRRGASENGGPVRLTLAAANGDIAAGDVVRALSDAAGQGREAEAWIPPVLTTVLPLETYATAAEAAAEGAPVALVAVSGRTRVDELRRAARLLDEAGGSVAGAILVCGRERDLGEVWA